ncbi:DegT/DnrJ/EryC1/StrS family aminotransferase [Butyrivibrio fibrisolvens]|uniref:DegT/DnrJ/EryC1/StrS family aminotransferase n=1 Tax=Butyrivibrio fibrisolvens TaxID=831 RepID=UPI0003B4DBE5|nr:DegT/DnrJ/EryC1/StrS family aminotransferase [Butyrivibrio fibrisolvens]
MKNNNDIFVTRSSMPPYEEYIEAIKPLWETHWLTNMGVYHQQLEKELAEYLDVPQISLTVNGHMALELAIQSFDFPEGSEIITTPFTFISTTHAIVRNKLKPVFCDVKESDGTIDEEKIEDLITEKTVAILPVHVFGNVCAIEKIQQIANDYNLKVIYDAAHAFGEKYLGRGIGNYGDVSIFSFHATKVFNTIEGGAVVCKTQEKYERLRDLKNFGIRGEELVASVGANAKMNEFAAIMGLCNLKHIDDAFSSRKKIYEYYEKEVENIDGLSLYTPKENATRNFCYFPIKVESDYSLTRDELYLKLLADNIHARKYFYPLTADQACFKNKYKDNPLVTARELTIKSMVLPLYEGLEEEYQRKIIQLLKL